MVEVLSGFQDKAKNKLMIPKGIIKRYKIKANIVQK